MVHVKIFYSAKTYQLNSVYLNEFSVTGHGPIDMMIPSLHQRFGFNFELNLVFHKNGIEKGIKQSRRTEEVEGK